MIIFSYMDKKGQISKDEFIMYDLKNDLYSFSIFRSQESYDSWSMRVEGTKSERFYKSKVEFEKKNWEKEDTLIEGLIFVFEITEEYLMDYNNFIDYYVDEIKKKIGI